MISLHQIQNKQSNDLVFLQETWVLPLSNDPPQRDTEDGNGILKVGLMGLGLPLAG